MSQPEELALWTNLACIWEVSARKVGNVHPGQEDRDLRVVDFLASAAAIAPVMAAPRQSLGATVLAAIRATRRVTGTNTNLGIVLLLAPLALADGADLGRVLDNAGVEDSRDVFEAIRLAQPGGLGEAAEQDVRDVPTLPLRAIMALAQDRDLVARQYALGFRDVLDLGLRTLLDAYARLGSLESAIVFTQLRWLAEFPDSLIQRRRGRAEAEQASRQARRVLELGWPSEAGQREFAELDRWMRQPASRRNPGTSADLLAACLFAALQGRHLNPAEVHW